jgi:hypothetical protein
VFIGVGMVVALVVTIVLAMAFVVVVVFVNRVADSMVSTFPWGMGQQAWATPQVEGIFTTARPVQYRVRGSAARVSITYNNAQGKREHITGVAVPWELSFRVETGAMLYLSAQNEGDVGTVTCEILIDEVVVLEATSSDSSTVASCGGADWLR